MNIVLIGHRGTGKSTVAEELANRLAWPGIDIDTGIEQSAGRSIAQIWADGGESAFRAVEAEALAALAARAAEGALDQHIVSAGGGAVVRPRNRQSLGAIGTCVWLTASPETIHQRLTADPKTASQRPNLTPLGGMTEIRTVLAQRAELYRQCADLQVDTEGKDAAAVAGEIIAALKLAP